MKYSKWIGITACVILIISCFLPWTFHADINKTFTGFFSQQSMYGKPGKFLCFFGVLSMGLFLSNALGAKRLHLFVAALFVGYAIKTFTLFAGCYNAYCPEKKYGLYLMIFSSLIILVASIFPDVKLKETNDDI